MADDIDFDYIDPDEIYSQFEESILEFWEDDLNFAENVINILGKCLIIPYPDIQLPIIASYILGSQKWARVLPLMFHYGDKGSGKSTTAFIAARIHGFKQTHAAKDTVVALRNTLDNSRWLNPETKTKERDGVILCWDNVGIDTLDDPDVYELMLIGYDRNSSRKATGGEVKGTNAEYETFAHKLFSSVHAIHENPSYDELHRRLLMIRHKPYHLMSDAEKKGNQCNPDTLVNFNNYNWDALSEKYFSFWRSRDVVTLYVQTRKALTASKKTFDIPMSSNRWVISIDILCTMIVLKIAKNIPEAISIMQAHWNYLDENFKNVNSEMEMVESYLYEMLSSQKVSQDVARATGKQPEKLKIQAALVGQFLKDRIRLGEIDSEYNKVKKQVALMNGLGYSRRTIDGEIFWVEKI
ncbi:hypothetical protein [Sphaerothrix gracilis]|uniref:hypothetical protein n=1 Tax=Sphaerothrix gracilis TaxID=3151835 RepID=UPI0031FCED3D